MADRHDHDRSDIDSAEDGRGVFDLFEPPPPSDPSSFGKVPVIKDSEIDLTDGQSSAQIKAAADAEAAGLQHWTAPPTGQLPAVLSEKDTKSGMWGDVAGPSWHGDDPTWSGPDLADVFADADSLRFQGHADDEDDEEEDEEYRHPAPQRRAAPRPPAGHAQDGSPPLAAAPERRERAAPQHRTELPQHRTEAPQQHQAESPPRPLPPERAERRPAAAPAPRPRRDPAPSPSPRPGAPSDESSWPTSAEPSPRLDRPAGDPVRGQRAQPHPRPERPSARPPRQMLDDRPGDPLAGVDPRRSPEVRREVGAQANPARWSGAEVRSDPGVAQGSGLFGDERGAPSIDDIEFAESRRGPSPAPSPGPGAGPRTLRGRPEPDELDYEPYDDYDDGYDHYDDDEGGRSGGRNLPLAIGVGVALVGALLAAMWVGPETTLLLVVVLALLGVVELFNAMRMAGLRPATLLGAVGTAAAPAAAYYRGDAALPLIIGMTVVFGSLWYLVGADSERPVLNLSLTMMGILWVGGLASFAGLMLRFDGGVGVELLLAAIIITVVSDTMAYIGGRAYGRRPFHPASPNKTWGGTMTGFLGALFAGFAIGVTDMGSLWDGNLVPALALGAVVGVLAPIGDLAESVVKRDLGVKDMGNFLPGHGGVLDRVDALLFALPGAYYVALITGIV